MKEKILQYLFHHREEFTSGEVLRREFNVSRTAIWKHMKALKEEGYQIESVPNKGYRLEVNEEQFLPVELEKILGNRIEVFSSIDSTNDYLKAGAKDFPDNMMVLSEEQTKGRGRLGREWYSPKGEGLFLSVLLKPRMTMQESFRITGIAAVAVAEAIEEVTGLPAKIKWPNDILVHGKKVCGVLTEVSGELDSINYIIVGVGINVNTRNFSKELKPRATSLFLEKGKKIPRKDLFLALGKKFFYFYHEYTEKNNFEEVQSLLEQRSEILGKEIYVLRGKEKKRGIALAITGEGFLRVRYETGEEEVLSSGEISLRGITGYA